MNLNSREGALAMTETSRIPMLTVRDAPGAIEFYKTAFGVDEVSRQTTPTGQTVAGMSIAGGPGRSRRRDAARAGGRRVRGIPDRGSAVWSATGASPGSVRPSLVDL